MASVLFTIVSVIMSALAFSSTISLFSSFADHGEKKNHKRHDLALERHQRARDAWNKDKIKCLDFINKRLGEKNK